MSSPLESRVYGAHWRKFRKLILERDGYLCQIQGPRCTVTATQVDHIVPVSAGGAWYEPEGLRAACASCNTARARRPVQRRPSRAW